MRLGSVTGVSSAGPRTSERKWALSTTWPLGLCRHPTGTISFRVCKAVGGHRCRQESLAKESLLVLRLHPQCAFSPTCARRNSSETLRRISSQRMAIVRRIKTLRHAYPNVPKYDANCSNGYPRAARESPSAAGPRIDVLEQMLCGRRSRNRSDMPASGMTPQQEQSARNDAPFESRPASEQQPTVPSSAGPSE